MKTILITGASGQLGSVVTAHFLNKGFKVIGAVHHKDGREVTFRDNLYIEEVDLADAKATEAFIEKMTRDHGLVDAALLLAGGFAMGDVGKTTAEALKRQVSLNFETAYHVIQPLFPRMMQANKGRIILIGSRPGLEASYGKSMIGYALSKSMLVTLAELLNETAKGTDVTVTVVAPSTIDTEVNRKSMPEAPFEKWVKPETLAELFEFICSDTATVLRETVLKAYHKA